MKPLTFPKLVLTLLTAVAFLPGARADIVHLDDVIIDGSACVGFDCVNGESFGFDTLRLKENNLRLHFDDTSTSASFPKNDWRLTANESSNGGLEKFSIDDATGGRIPFTIEAGARTNALYVEDDGDIGIGTNTPAVDLHIKTGNTPTLRLEQDGSSGFTPQTWDVAGNEANFFIRDATSGSTLPFRLYPGAPTSALTIEGTTGDIGVGTTSPETEVHIVDSGPAILRLDNTTASAWDLNSGGGGIFRFSDVGDTDVEFQLTQDGDLTVTGTIAANSGADTLPDYVFESDYELMPLADLESFINKNGHLPKVPNKADVEKAGGTVNMTEMQMKLLEKIEELTLYTLQQQEEIKELKSSLEKLGND